MPICPAARARFLAVALAAFACGKDRKPQSFAGLSRVSGQSPFAAGCANPSQAGTNFRSAEVEPFVAIDPLDANHLVGVWQQDRWSNGGSNGLGSAASFDGGKSWTASFPAFTTCSGGTAAKGSDFERASDPWVTFAPDGTAHEIAFSFDSTAARGAMLAVRSKDGGRTWSDPLTLASDNDPDVALDKESITADPKDPNLVYAVWDRLTGVSSGSTVSRGPAWFTRTTDGGASWEPARIIYDPGDNAQTIGNQVAVLPDGTLINVMTVILQQNQASSPIFASLVRSADKGVTWSATRIDIAPQQVLGVLDPKNRLPIRTGDILPDVAVDPASGAIYVAWEDSRAAQGARDGIVLSRSTDGGASWSTPVRVNGAPQVQAFTPSLAVTSDGKLGVTYYDLRDDDPGDDSVLLATAWLAVSADGGQTFQESAISGPFDLRSAAKVDGQKPASIAFVGDYQGLVASGTAFFPFFALAIDGDQGNPSDIFARPPGAAAVSRFLAAEPLSLGKLQRVGLRRAF